MMAKMPEAAYTNPRNSLRLSGGALMNTGFALTQLRGNFTALQAAFRAASENSSAGGHSRKTENCPPTVQIRQRRLASLSPTGCKKKQKNREISETHFFLFRL